jgi:hypothetical protein
MKRMFKQRCQQFHQYQQNEQSPLTSGFSGLEEITKHLPGGVFAEVNTKETKGRSFTLLEKKL